MLSSLTPGREAGLMKERRKNTGLSNSMVLPRDGEFAASGKGRSSHECREEVMGIGIASGPSWVVVLLLLLPSGKEEAGREDVYAACCCMSWQHVLLASFLLN